jgi:hypothetical protein
MDSPRLTYTPHPDATPEAQLKVLANVYRYVLLDSQTNKGGSNDLTKNVTKECTTRPEKKGTDNADVHRNGL